MTNDAIVLMNERSEEFNWISNYWYKFSFITVNVEMNELFMLYKTTIEQCIVICYIKRYNTFETIAFLTNIC